MLRDYSTQELLNLAYGLGANSFLHGKDADPYSDQDLNDMRSEHPEGSLIEKKLVKSWLLGYNEAKSLN